MNDGLTVGSVRDWVGAMYSRINDFFASILVVCVLPLLPMAVEFLVTQDLLFSTLIITSVMYSMSMTLTSGDKVLFILSYFWAVFGSMAFMMHLGGGNLAPPSSFKWIAYFMIFVCFAFHAAQRFIEHVVLGNEFKLLGGIANA